MALPAGATITAGDVVQATLVWFSNADFDLRVVTPAGNVVNLGNEAENFESPEDNGLLNGDVIPGCGDDPHHVENIFFPADPSAPVLVGEYRAFFRPTGSCDNAFPVDVVLSLEVSGQESQVVTGTLSDQSDALNFELAATLDGPSGGVILEP